MADDGRARAHDVVVFGATGFVGRLVAAHLEARVPADVRVALAGRSQARLAAVHRGLGPRAADWTLLVVDAADADAVDAMAAAGRVVATTVGPYARHGLGVVGACARAGTDYVDLAGEVLFVRDSIDAHHNTAVATGARIVHACGFDSVPSDLSVLLAARAAAADGAGVLAWATLVLRSATGALSGGTVDSLRVQLDELAADPARARIVDDPDALSPDPAAEPDRGRARDTAAAPRWDPQLGMWTGPFTMAPYNTRIVRRSNALQGWAYGRRLRYREVVGFGRGWTALFRATGMAGGMAAALGAMRIGPARAVLDHLLPVPGEGPDARERRRGHFRFELHAVTVTGARYRVVFGARGDPGYAATAVMMGESTLALAERAALPAAAGVLTPATGIGPVLADRLRTAGFEIAVDRNV